MKSKAHTVLIILIISLSCFGLFYKPYVISNKVDDFGISEFGSSLFGISIFAIISYIGLLRLTKYRILDTLIFGVFFFVMDSLGLIWDRTASLNVLGPLLGTFLAMIILLLIDKKLFIKELAKFGGN
ncbi:hypothetical protein [Allomuricauda sp. SCSIO 65647]|uniref:hypothetical protein n=1 Tax=Allomuricauda sp. SCSIO 65647 TaxID=2908843 RepID=UPI001F399A5D|nr:hypothetical protein [Muricauda sp. SCSIO 65647]UJH67230.1 hypothetical protein L0P89_14920 [Muricauda sp. SCSIO 65647]